MLYEDRPHIADTLFAIPVPIVFVPDKPSFQIAIIAFFIGLKSWLLFHLLGQNGAWLCLPVCKWKNNQEY